MQFLLLGLLPQRKESLPQNLLCQENQNLCNFNASSAALSKIQAAEEHLKEHDAIAKELDNLAMEDLLLKAKKREHDHQLKERNS